MQIAGLAGFALGAAIVVWIVNSLQKSLRHKAKAKQLGCKPPARQPQVEPTGLLNLIRGARASKQKRFPEYAQELFNNMQQREGRIVGTSVMTIPFFKDMIFTSEPRNIQAMLALKFKDFGLGINRTENFKPLLGNGIFAANGKQWEHSRALLRPQFVRSQVSDLDLEETHVKNMMSVIDRHLGGDGWTDTIDLQVLFFRLTLDSATQFLFGESVNSQLELAGDITNSSGQDDNSFSYAFDRSQFILAIAARLGNNYWMMHTPEFHRMVDRVHKFVDYFVQKAMKASSEKEEVTEHYVFLHALAKQTQDPDELRSQLINILLAGRDTTASLLGWFFHIVSNPEYQHIFHRLRQIILDEFGTYSNPREITFERMKSCQYLQWCINEALRLYPVVPMNVRTALTDTTLPTGGGPDGQSPVFIAKGVDVGYSVYLMHRRKDLWGDDAETFKPQRWENRKPGWEYLPFNGGPRICIGQQFALTEIAYVIIRMLQRIDAVDPAGVGPLRHGLTLTMCPADGVKLRLHTTS